MVLRRAVRGPTGHLCCAPHARPPAARAPQLRGSRSAPVRGSVRTSDAGTGAAPQKSHAHRLLKRQSTRAISAYSQEREEEEKAAFLSTRVLEVKAEDMCNKRGLWCPTYWTRQAWDLFMLTLIVYSCVVVPYRIGLDSPAEGITRAFENMVTVLFITDLTLNFNTAYVEGQYVVIDR